MLSVLIYKQMEFQFDVSEVIKSDLVYIQGGPIMTSGLEYCRVLRGTPKQS